MPPHASGLISTRLCEQHFQQTPIPLTLILSHYATAYVCSNATMAAQQIQIAETIRAMKLALKRRPDGMQFSPWPGVLHVLQH